MWEDLDEIGDVQSLKSDVCFVNESSLPICSRSGLPTRSGNSFPTASVSSSSTPSEEINPALPEETVMSSF